MEVIGEEGVSYLPRPTKREKLLEIFKSSRKVVMPPSTYERIPEDIKRRYKDKIKIISLRGRFSRYDPHTITTVISMRRSGMSVRKIAEAVGLPKSTVHYIISYLKRVEAGNAKIVME